MRAGLSLIRSLCYIVPESKFRPHDERHLRNERESESGANGGPDLRLACCRFLRFIFGIEARGIETDGMDGTDWDCGSASMKLRLTPDGTRFRKSNGFS